MGELVARRYPTKLLADLADHTYIECGTGGRGWSCWGGKTGGTELRRGGVCHQAANRILLPAAITVRGARGYEVSEALFGTYGRPGGIFGLCKAPFDQHGGTTGDLPACTAPALRAAKRRKTRRRTAAASAGERRYLRGVLAIYRKARAPFASATRARSFAAGRDLEAFHLELFMHQVDFKLGSRVDRTLDRRLRRIRRSTERARLKIEEWFMKREMNAAEFVDEFDNETRVFQHAVAGAMKPAQYKRLFDLTPGTIVTLADPRIVKKAFAR